MITGDKVRPIKSFWPIDHCSEGFGRSRPMGDEEFYGIPYGWFEVQSPPFIEVHIDGKVVRTINALDCSEIEFI